MTLLIGGLVFGGILSVGIIGALYRIEMELKRIRDQLLVNFLHDQQNHESVVTNLLKSKLAKVERRREVQGMHTLLPTGYDRLLDSELGDSVGDSIGDPSEAASYPRESESPILNMPMAQKNCFICDEQVFII